METLTNELADKAWQHLQEIEAQGGMAKAIEAGLPKLRIEEAAARTQASIDSGTQIVVGVNQYQLENETPIDVLQVNNAAVLEQQIEKLNHLRSTRDAGEHKRAIDALAAAASGTTENLLALAINAARARATVGEISAALEQTYGRHVAKIQKISGVYKEAMGNHTGVPDVQSKTQSFAEHTGRRPRVLLAKMGQDGHDRGQKVIASAFADLGFAVDIGALFQTPEEVAEQAIANDVHIVGASSLAAGHLTMVPELRKALKDRGREDILIVVGGVIPPQDVDSLTRNGAAAIFPPGTVVVDAADDLIEKLLANFHIQN